MEHELRSPAEATRAKSGDSTRRRPWFMRLSVRSRDSHWKLQEIERFDRASEKPGALFAGRKWYGG